MNDPWAAFADAPSPAGSPAADPWAGFKPVPANGKRKRRGGMFANDDEPVVPSGDMIDGDTFRAKNGPNARLAGVDAFELSQSGRALSGLPVPLGDMARQELAPFAVPSAAVTPRGAAAYGRAAVSIGLGGKDAGESLISQGLAVPVPRYLTPELRASYMPAQRSAIAAERGAYGGTYQLPADWRAQGSGAPWRGKILMNADQAAKWERLVRNPATTPQMAGDWLRTQGHSAENVDNLIRFLSRNPQAEPNPAFQQQDAEGKPVQAAPRNLLLRGMDALNEGIIDIAATPFELSHAIGKLAGNALGVEMEEASPYARWLREKWHSLGLGQRDEGSAPQSDVERYAQAFLRGTGSAAIPLGGTLSLGGKLALRTPSAATAASAGRSAVRESLVDAAKNPGTAAALELGSGAGSYIGEEVAHDVAPGNPYAAIAGQVIGGLGGGLSAGAATRRVGARSSGDRIAPADGPPRPLTEFDPDAPMIERDGALFARAADGREVPIPIDPSGHPGVVWNQDHWEALVQVEGDGAAGYGPQEAPNSLPSRYRDLAVELNGNLPRPMGAPKVKQGGLEPSTAAPASPAPQARAADEAHMEGGAGRQELIGPAADPWSGFADALAPTGGPRQRDVIDVNARPQPLLDPATEYLRMQAAQRVAPRDVLPIPSSRVADVDEAAAIERSRYARERAGDPSAELETRGYRSPKNGLAVLRRKGPPDLVTWLRSEGGLRLSDQDAGEFRHYGIDNTPRDLEFAKGEGQLGKLLDEEGGMDLDYAAMRAWEAGYFPDLPERPTINEFMDALVSTHRGGSGRVFHPDDLPELDRYRDAQGQYNAVKAAEQAGAPLVTDRSQPATLDDLDVNAAPVRAYEEWGENAPDFAGNLRLAGLESPQDIKRALATAHDRIGGFDAARRGRITQAETESLAADLGMTPDDLVKRRKGQAFNAEEALAARQILAKSANELVNMARRISRAAGDPSTEDAARFREAWLRHVAIQEQVAGMTAEAGRALQQFRQAADSRAIRGTVLPEMVEAAGGVRKLKEAADMIVDQADDPANLNRITKQALKPGLKDKLLELWYNSLLSGPQTHAVNILSNTITNLAQVPEHAVAAAFGAPRAMLNREAERVLFSEIGARTVGLLAGAREGLRNAAHTFKTGDTPDAMSKVEVQQHNAIGGRVGHVLRTPTRALAAEDELFKAMARRQELYGLAIRKAAADGLKGDAARARAAELIANPTDDMIRQAFDYGRYLTFQRPLSTGHGVSQGALIATSKVPLLKLFLPFVRTPANLLKFALERSPAAPIVKEWRKDFAAGGARRDLALARASVGSGVIMLVMQLVEQGLITGGGPADEGAREMLRADGWQPYSLKIGDQYYSYQRLDPLASTLGVAADIVDLQSHMTENQREQVYGLVLAATLKNLSSKTWLSGVSDAVEAVSEPERRASAYISRLAGSVFVPAGVAQIARTTDPVLREAREPLDRIRSRLPGVSSSLPPRRDVLGRPMTSEGGLGPDIMSPIWTSTRRGDVIPNALLDAGLKISRPDRKIKADDGNVVELTPEHYDTYQALTGDIARPQLNALIMNPMWAQLRPDEQDKDVDRIMRDARAEARRIVMLGITPKPRGAPIPPGVAGLPDPWLEFADAPR